MYKICLFTAVACLAACSPQAPPSNVSAVDATPSPVASATAAAIDAKAMYAAETLFNVPAQAYATLDAKGLLTAETKAYAKPKLLAAYDALKLARQAYAVSDSVGFDLAVKLLKSNSDQLKAKGLGK